MLFFNDGSNAVKTAKPNALSHEHLTLLSYSVREGWMITMEKIINDIQISKYAIVEGFKFHVPDKVYEHQNFYNIAVKSLGTYFYDDPVPDIIFNNAPIQGIQLQDSNFTTSESLMNHLNNMLLQNSLNATISIDENLHVLMHLNDVNTFYPNGVLKNIIPIESYTKIIDEMDNKDHYELGEIEYMPFSENKEVKVAMYIEQTHKTTFTISTNTEWEKIRDKFKGIKENIKFCFQIEHFNNTWSVKPLFYSVSPLINFTLNDNNRYIYFRGKSNIEFTSFRVYENIHEKIFPRIANQFFITNTKCNSKIFKYISSDSIIGNGNFCFIQFNSLEYFSLKNSNEQEMKINFVNINNEMINFD